MTQTQLASAVADRAEISRTEAKRVLAGLEEIVLEELGNAHKVRIGGLVQLTVRVKPAQKARKGRNPATGEEITIAAKPASVDLRGRPLAGAKRPRCRPCRRPAADSPPEDLTPRRGAGARRALPGVRSRMGYRMLSGLSTTGERVSGLRSAIVER